MARGEAVEIGGGSASPTCCARADACWWTRHDEPDLRARLRRRGHRRHRRVSQGHASNFRVEGFTAAVEERDLVELGEQTDVPVLHDVGSGALLPTERYGLAHEPMPQEAIAAGVGLVFFSRDKLLGGPQPASWSGNENCSAGWSGIRWPVRCASTR